MDALLNIGIGILMIVFGIFVILFVSKRPSTYPLFSITFKGYAFGVISILFGIIYILNKLHLW